MDSIDFVVDHLQDDIKIAIAKALDKAQYEYDAVHKTIGNSTF